MNTMRCVFLICAAAAVAACSPTRSTLAARGPGVNGALVMVPLDQVRYYRQAHSDAEPRPAAESGRTTVSSVLTQPTVSAIQLNRYADPARPDELMHEAHVVYRRDTGARWRLRPASRDEQILFGPQLTDGRGEIHSLASQELESYLQQQRRNLQQQQHVMAQMTEGVRQLATQQQAIAEELGRLKAKLGGPADGTLAQEPAASSAGDERRSDGGVNKLTNSGLERPE
jgi:hypothetical protein